MPLAALIAATVVLLGFIGLVAYVVSVAMRAVVDGYQEGSLMTRQMVADARVQGPDVTQLLEASGTAITGAIQAAYGPVMAPAQTADMDKTMAEMLEEAGADGIELDDEDVADWTDAFIPDPGGPMGPGAVAVDMRGRTVNVFDVDAPGEFGD